MIKLKIKRSSPGYDAPVTYIKTKLAKNVILNHIVAVARPPKSFNSFAQKFAATRQVKFEALTLLASPL